MNLTFFKEKIKKLARKFFLINDSPHKVAGGAALGIFLGIIPGEGVLATLFFSSIFRLNRLAALAGVGVVNMWTTFLLFPPAAAIGGWIFGMDYDSLRTSFDNATNAGIKYFLSKAVFFDLTLPLIVGFAVVAGAISFLVYLGLLYFLIKKKHLRKDAHLLEKKIILQVKRDAR
jgi:uncharacterized protein (DUF2062 family)